MPSLISRKNISYSNYRIVLTLSPFLSFLYVPALLFSHVFPFSNFNDKSSLITFLLSPPLSLLPYFFVSYQLVKWFCIRNKFSIVSETPKMSSPLGVFGALPTDLLTSLCRHLPMSDVVSLSQLDNEMEKHVKRFIYREIKALRVEINENGKTYFISSQITFFIYF